MTLPFPVAVVVVMAVTAWVVTVGIPREEKVTSPAIVDCPGRISGIGPDVIQRTGGKAGDSAGKGARRADRSIGGLTVCCGGIGVFQTTPCSVGLGTPRTVTLPLPVAVVVVIFVTAWVVTVGDAEE